MTDKMWEAFEKWAKAECLDLDSVDGFYSDNDTHIAWGAWQAAQTAAVPVVGDVEALICDDCGAETNDPYRITKIRPLMATSLSITKRVTPIAPANTASANAAYASVVPRTLA